ncbi:uncharacterized protein LOC142418917 isoform X4 [Mycteria americana]|uniref:uncharacterized protein LOC142418917 isoform X4 n=1 Tax=Mycteria americana TaxID=33587 RepID=UPI003F585AE8
MKPGEVQRFQRSRVQVAKLLRHGTEEQMLWCRVLPCPSWVIEDKSASSYKNQLNLSLECTRACTATGSSDAEAMQKYGLAPGVGRRAAALASRCYFWHAETERCLMGQTVSNEDNKSNLDVAAFFQGLQNTPRTCFSLQTSSHSISARTFPANQVPKRISEGDTNLFIPISSW